MSLPPNTKITVNKICPRCGGLKLREGWTCATDVWMVTIGCDGCNWQTPICLTADAAVEYIKMYERR